MRRLVVVAGTIAAALVCASSALAGPTFRNTKVIGPPGAGWPWNEPRISQGPDGRLWVSSIGDDSAGTFNVWSSANGGRTFEEAPTAPTPQITASPDTDVVTMPSGRVIATELDEGDGINFPTWFTDDGGRTWTQSHGSNQLADQDRQWLAVGPDPVTHQQDVYLLFHNLASGNAQHNMFVAKSTDGGATFGVPVPITLPGSNAYTDLQCADSGGPSAIFVNKKNGTVYAEFTTRASPTAVGDLGGCAPLASGQPLEFNIVAGTRVWVAQSNNGGATWKDSLAVDDASTGQIVSMQLAYGGLDSAGNVYVAYPESPLGVQYPDYSGAGVRYKFAAPAPDGNLKWSAPRTFAPAAKGSPGDVLVHMAVGDPGKLEGFYWTGVPQAGKDPLWYMTATETLNGLDAKPHFENTRISNVPADVGTASTLMGACTSEGPVTGVVNGLACGRSPDVWGVTLQHNCMPAVTWPAVDNGSAAPGNDPGTWVSVQTGGEPLCKPPKH